MEGGKGDTEEEPSTSTKIRKDSKEFDGSSTERSGLSLSVRRSSAIGLLMESKISSKSKSITRRQWILLIFLGLTDLLSSMTVSLQAPFYPIEAEKKGATALEYGLVFGIFEFIIFLTGPLFGKYMNKLGPKAVLTVSILVSSVSVIGFGLLDLINDHTWFITLSFVLRIIDALGVAGFMTATFVVIACEFPDSIATTFASLETVIGLGFIVGPTVGAALYSAGGFQLPFFVIGAIMLFTGILAVFVMPKTEKVTNDEGEEEKGFGILTVLKIPSVALAALSIVSTAMSMGFVSAILEPHIRPFGLSAMNTGLVFIVHGGVYAVTAPLWGYLCDHLVKRPVYITVLGNAFIFISFLLIGPASFIPIDTTLWVTIVGLVIQGLGFGCCFVSTFIVGLRDCMKHGLPDNMNTYAVISGLFQSMISVGAWIGPSAGGFLYDTVGFRDGSYLILVTSFVSGITVLLHTWMTSFTTAEGREDGEFQPLLRSEVRAPKGAIPSSSYGSASHQA